MKIESPELNPTLFYGPIISYEFHGNISKDKGGYRFRYSLTFKSGDIYNTQKSAFRTITEATKAKEHLIADLALNRHCPFQYTVKEIFDYWLYYEQIEVRKIAYNTFQTDRNILYNYLLPSLGANTKLKNVTTEKIIRAVRKISYPSIKEKACHLIKQVFEYAYSHNYIAYNACLAAYMVLKKEIQRPKRRDVICSIEKVKTLLYLCKHNFDEMYLPLLLSLTMGTRISETIGLKYSDIDFSAHIIYIKRQLGRSMDGENEQFLVSSQLDTKTARGIRHVPVPDWVIDEIIMQRAKYEQNKKNIADFQDMDYICCRENGTPFHRKSFSKDFKKLLEMANVPEMHWHDLRHIYASVLKNNSVNMKAISEYLGHYSPDFTSEVYVHHDEIVHDCSSLSEEWEQLTPTKEKGSVTELYIPFDNQDYTSLFSENKPHSENIKSVKMSDKY